MVRDTQDNVIARSTQPVVSDVGPGSLPLWFTLEAQVADLERVYILSVYDHDEWSANELMFETQPFAAADAQRDGRLHRGLLSHGGQPIGSVHFRFDASEEKPTAKVSW